MLSKSVRPYLFTLISAAVAAAGAQGTARAVAYGQMCDQAAIRAAQNSDVPLEILMAISRVETGRSELGVVTPWPWAINQEGQGSWFDDEQQAIDHANELLAQGVENFDVGCFQINLHWHGENFGSIEDAFDPDTNAGYAAKVLTELLQSEGSWAKAVAAYHSRTPDLAQAYLVKVDAALTELRAQGGAPTMPDATLAMADVALPRENKFPLLRAGAQGSGASLVPITDGGIPLFAATP